MKPPTKKSGKPPRRTAAADAHLTTDETVLWTFVAASIAPIRAKPRVPDRNAGSDGLDIVAPAPQRKPPRDIPGAPAKRASSHVAATPRPTVTPPLADFDSRKTKRIAKGRTGIDARLDLHGLRQNEAHTRLRHFLADCHHRGLKHVLVITGKGRESDDAGMAFADTFDRPERGILRRNLPRWLAEPDLRRLVVGYTTATQRHGGDGAFYIELRRPR